MVALPFDGKTIGPVKPSQKNQAGHTATISIHFPAQHPSNSFLVAGSTVQHCCLTRTFGSLRWTLRKGHCRRKLSQDNMKQFLHCSLVTSIWLACPKRFRKREKKISKNKTTKTNNKPACCTSSNSLWDLKHLLQWQPPIRDKHFQLEIGLGARKNVCMLSLTYQS